MGYEDSCFRLQVLVDSSCGSTIYSWMEGAFYIYSLLKRIILKSDFNTKKGYKKETT